MWLSGKYLTDRTDRESGGTAPVSSPPEAAPAMDRDGGGRLPPSCSKPWSSKGKDSEPLRLAERENGEPRCQASVTH